MTRYVVAQLGARMHYAVPRILFAASRLEKLYSDICVPSGMGRWASLIPRPLQPASFRRLVSRNPAPIPREHIGQNSWQGLAYYVFLRSARTEGARIRVHLWAGRKLCEQVIKRGFGAATGVYCFNSAGLELLREARRRGLRAVLEQTIAPRLVEEEILDGERRAHPGWCNPQGTPRELGRFITRERAEWDAADTIVCGSEFVREQIEACGGPIEKCRVVPYGVEVAAAVPVKKRHQMPLRVLSVGTPGLRKGTPYLLEAAERLSRQAEFRIVGAGQVPPLVERHLPSHIRFMGQVPRAEMHQQFCWADVFVLPSLCEGSATATYESLAFGVPVICTPNTGSIVRDGEEGFLVPVRDSEAIVHRLQELSSNRSVLDGMAKRARARAQHGSISAYAARLLAIL